jgi:hypothetical protein
MMGVTVKRFLTQLKRHDRESYESLPEEFRNRYAPAQNRLFGDVDKTDTARRHLRQQVADDMWFLIRRYENDPDHAERSTFRMLERVFHEQCEIVEDAIVINTKPGGDAVQNPSDPDAGRDQKGPGYQVQIAETCNPDNDVQIVTGVQVESAAESDSNATVPMVDDLTDRGMKPDSLQADAAYGGDDNVQACDGRGVELVSPTGNGGVSRIQDLNMPGSDGAALATMYDTLTIDDFAMDESETIIECCPNGVVPLSSQYDASTETVRAMFASSTCLACPYQSECPVRRKRGSGEARVVEFTKKERRLASRRREELTDEFRNRYRRRSGIEATNSSLKRRLGFGRLRVRGLPRVRQSVLMKLAGWNLLQASRCLKNRKMAIKRADMTCFRRISRERYRKTAINGKISRQAGHVGENHRRFSSPTASQW